MRISLLIISLIFIFISCGDPQRDVEILWDQYGIPHIYAQNPDDLFYAYGWAQAHAHGDLLCVCTARLAAAALNTGERIF